jgi:chromosome segregation ATPase
MTIASIRKAAREFVAGVRAIPRFAPTSEMRYEYYDNAFKKLRSKLDSERAARQKAEAELAEERGLWKNEHQNGVELTHEIYSLKSKLTSAIETIDALTRWRLQSEEPRPVVDEQVEFADDPPSPNGTCTSLELSEEEYWRHTPESWEAARKAGTDGNS